MREYADCWNCWNYAIPQHDVLGDSTLVFSTDGQSLACECNGLIWTSPEDGLQVVMASNQDFDAIDPFPDVHALFLQYNTLYFDNGLGACSVEWSSSRMTL